MTMFAMRLVISLVCCLICANISSASEIHDEADSIATASYHLEEYVITGTRIPSPLKDTPVQTRLITAKDIERSDASDVAELLQTVMPGVEYNYAMNQQPHLNIGGFGGQNVLFLIDGERLAGEIMDDPDLSRIDMNNVERIEIVRGASSALYGSNAAGGVVNIITKKPSKPLNFLFDTRFSKHDERRYRLSLANRFSHISNSLSLSASRINSYIVDNKPGPKANVITTVFGHKSLNISESLTWHAVERLNISARGGFFMRQLPREVDAPERYRAYSAGLKGEWSISDADNMHLSYSFDQYDKSIFRKQANLDIRHYSNVNNSVRLLYNHSFNSDNVITFGADYRHDFLLNSKIADRKCHQNSFDAFLQYDFKHSSVWELVANARYDYFGALSGYYDIKGLSKFSPRISVRYTLIELLNFRVAYGIGFRAPSLKERFYDFDMAGIWIVRGNPNLKPETSHNINLSIDYTHRQYNVTATTFYNYVVNRITTGIPYYLPDDSNKLVLDYINIPNYHCAGSELSINASWRCGISASLSYAYTHEFEVCDNQGRKINDQYMPIRPHSIVARGDWHKRFSNHYAIDLGLNGRVLSATSNSELVDYYNPTLGYKKVYYPAYTIWKLSFIQHIHSKLTISLAVDNLFNYRPDYYYLNAPTTDGITLRAGLTINI